jgi:hypothetical protein
VDLRPLDLDVVQESQFDDVHAELGVLDQSKSIDDFFARRHLQQSTVPQPLE